MCFKLRPWAGMDGGRRWRWTIYSDLFVLVLRDGETGGERDEAERATRVAVAALSGALRLPPPR